MIITILIIKNVKSDKTQMGNGEKIRYGLHFPSFVFVLSIKYSITGSLINSMIFDTIVMTLIAAAGRKITL